jgi:hypothetical protein
MHGKDEKRLRNCSRKYDGASGMDLFHSGFENKTRNTTHNRREHNPRTQTRVHIERTCMFNNISKKRRQQFRRKKKRHLMTTLVETCSTGLSSF